MHLSIRLPGGSDIKITNLSKPQLAEGYRENFDDFSLRADSSWLTRDTTTTQRVFGGVSCRIVYETNDPNLDTKLRHLQAALETFGAAGAQWKLPGDKLEVYFTTQQFSVGWVILRPGRPATEPSAVLILGQSVINPVGSVLASKLRQYYQPTFTVNADESYTRACVFHEFGHIYHQLRSPSHYFALVSLGLLANNFAGGGLRDLSEMLTHRTHGPNYMRYFPGTPSKQDFINYRKRYQNAGQSVSARAKEMPTEFVAEVFCGLMAGVPFDDLVMRTYDALGGVRPDDTMVHHRTGQSFVKRNVLYPLRQQVKSNVIDPIKKRLAGGT